MRHPRPKKQRHSVAASTSSHRARSLFRNLTASADALLVAAAEGWGTTLRYGLLLLVRNGSLGLGIWILCKVAMYIGLL